MTGASDGDYGRSSGVPVDAEELRVTATMGARSGLVSVHGTDLYYEELGEGHPVILLHAGIADSRMWDEQMPVLAERYRVVRYDLRGFGRSKMVAGAFSHRADLAALLDALGIASAALVGCSFGGRVATEFALEFPYL